MLPIEFIKREQEVQEAARTYSDLELGEAYKRWKEARGEVAEMLLTSDESLQRAKALIHQAAKKPCTQPGCKGEMELESVCGGCIEGRKGFKSKWTCAECLHRELSTKGYQEWLTELASSLKESSSPSV